METGDIRPLGEYKEPALVGAAITGPDIGGDKKKSSVGYHKVSSGPPITVFSDGSTNVCPSTTTGIATSLD